MSEEPISTLDLRGHIAQLEAERALAQLNGLGEVAAYMADLEEELGYRRRLFIAAAVTEIATLREELSGPQVG